MNSVKHVAMRHFRTKERLYQKDKINELAIQSKNKNIRDIEEKTNIRRITNLEVTWKTMRMVIIPQMPRTF
jgi:hypothetical protein